MPKPWPRRYHDPAAAKQLQPGIERDLSEGHDNADLRELCDLRIEMIETPRDFLWQWLVAWRRAPYGGQDIRIGQREAIINASRSLDIRKARTMKGRHQEVTGSVSGKYAPGAISSVSSGCKAHEQ